jgi:hypothetical protein
MSLELFALDSLPGAPQVALREIAGCDEATVTDSDAVASIQLLDRLLVDVPEVACRPCGAIDIAISDRDRLLAAVYVRTYGPRIKSTVNCQRCDQPFDLDFSLTDVCQVLSQSAKQAEIERCEDGSYRLLSGQRFRLPTGRDELEVSKLSPEEAAAELLARCLLEKGGEDQFAVQAAMETVGPLLLLDLGAVCPECGEEQEVRFDVQSYVLRSLAQDRQRLALDIHRLATAYGWSREEILSIPRSQRRAYIALIEADASARARWPA